MLHDCARNANALPLPAGKTIGALIGKARQSNRVEQVIRLIDIGLREFAQPCVEGGHIAEAPDQQIFHDGQALDQVVFLKHHADAAARSAQRGAFQLCQILPLKHDLARSRLDQPVNAANQCRFAGAGWANDRGDAFARDIEIDAFQYRHAALVFFYQATNLQRSIRHFTLSCFLFSKPARSNASPLLVATSRTAAKSCW